MRRRGKLISFFLVSIGCLLANDNLSYENNIAIIREKAHGYAEDARDLGLGSPFRYNVDTYEWPSRFARNFTGYAEFREGFHVLFLTCDEQFNSWILSRERDQRRYLEIIKISQDSEDKDVYEERLIKIRQDLLETPLRQSKVQNVLHLGWDKIQKQFQILYAKFDKLQDPLLYFHRGMLFLDEGRFFEAILEMEKVIDSGEMNKVLDEINSGISELEMDMAKSYSELGEYTKAIELLSNIIRRHPEEKEAYFERAAAYFELGEFDLCLEDYLKQRKESVFSYIHDPELFAFSKGLTIGAKNGSLETAIEFFPSLLGSLRGMGNLLWAVVEHPIDAPKQYAEATISFCSYLRSCNKKELAKIVVPEMYQLITNWDDLAPEKRGELAGHVLGKYGLDAILATGIYKGIKTVDSYRKLKKAEKLCTLETLARSPETRIALEEASAKWIQTRSEWFLKIEIEMDKQGKHIPSHRNFDSNAAKSIWTHSGPQVKIKELAGKGQKTRGVPGQAGYQERVDCGEVIGYFVSEDGKEKLPTTMATIHYSKKGAHIVPARPKSKK